MVDREPLRPFRAPDALWNGAADALEAVEQPRRVVVTVRPGMTRSAAIRAFLEAVIKGR